VTAVAIEIVLVAGLAAGAAALFARTFPKATSWIVTARMIIAALGAVAIAAILISTNVGALMLLGGVMIFLLGLNYFALDTGTAVW
jgi:hypothetical protein